MNMDFANGMREAMRLIQARKLSEATRVIQGTLSGGEYPAGEADSTRAAPAITGNVIDLKAEVIEPEAMREPGSGAGLSAHLSPPKLPAWATRLGALVKGRGDSGFLPLNLDARTKRARRTIEVPDGAQFLSRSYACAAGTRNYKLYVPRRVQEKGPALVVMLHGGTQDGEDFAAGTRMNALAEEHGFIVAYPSQCKAANASMCWNWFAPEHQKRGAGEPAIIAGITREIMAAHPIDPDRVFIAGLSAGGAMAAVMAATYPDLYAAVGVHSGLPYQSASDLPSAFAAMRGDAGPLRGIRSRKSRGVANDTPRMRTIVFHGDADNIVHSSNAAEIVGASKIGERSEHAETRSADGRTYTRKVIRDQSGAAVVEDWLLHGSGHAWSGGSAEGSYTDPSGPDASREMLRFFLETNGDRRP
jgi:poly(hydroxyalkanoate) depolymerase family esterase